MHTEAPVTAPGSETALDSDKETGWSPWIGQRLKGQPPSPFSIGMSSFPYALFRTVEHRMRTDLNFKVLGPGHRGLTAPTYSPCSAKRSLKFLSTLVRFLG